MLILLFILLLASPVYAATYYVNPATGLDSNSGTVGSPWKTLVKIKNTAVAGDTVNFIGGNYTQAQVQGEGGVPNWTTSHHKGTVGNPIIIQANPGQTVTFDGGAANYFQRFYATVATDFYVIIQNITFTNYSAVIGVEGTSSTNVARHVAVINCRFTTLGQNGSGLAVVNSGYVILKENYLSNLGTHGIYVSDGANFTVVTANTVLGAGDNGTGPSGGAWNIHVWGGHALAPSTNNVIVRRNVLTNGLSGNLIVAGIPYNKVYVYNNTMYDDSSHLVNFGCWTTHNGGTFNHFITKNNICSGYSDVGSLFSDAGQAYPGDFILDYNLWQNLSGLPVYSWNGSTYNLTTFRAIYGYELHSINANPLYTNPAALDFTLQAGSPAIDTGQVLTTAVGSGTSSTSLTVADAGYFHDGYGLIVGDTIQVGFTEPVAVTAVNYSTNVLTLASSRTWTSGQGVTLPFNGIAPDMGAFETAGGGGPIPSGIFYVSPSGSNTFTCAESQDITKPKHTIVNSLTNCIHAGDTLLIRAGTYGEIIDTSITPILGGSSWAAPTTIAAYLNETVIIQNPTVSAAPLALHAPTTDHYIIFDKLIIDGNDVDLANTNGVVLGAGAAHIKFMHGRIHHTKRTGLYMNGVSDVTISSTRIDHVSGSATAALVVTDTVDGVTLENLEIDTNVVHGIYFDTVGTKTNSVINANILHENATAAKVALTIQGTGLISNNLLWGNTAGIQVLTGSAGLQVYNNTVTENTGNGIQIDATATGTLLKNTISYLNGAQIVNNGTGTVQTTNLVIDPTFVNAGTHDYRLDAGSAAIDTGTTLANVPLDLAGVVRPQGAGYDIGAYERFVVTVPTVPYRASSFQ